MYGALPSDAFCPCGSTAFRGAVDTGGRGSSSSGVLDSGATGERGVCSPPAAAAAAAGWALEGEEENLEEMLESQELRRMGVVPWRGDLPGRLAGEPTLSEVGIVRVGGPARWGIWRGVEGVSRGAVVAVVVPFVFGAGDERRAMSDERELDRSDRVERVLSGEWDVSYGLSVFSRGSPELSSVVAL